MFRKTLAALALLVSFGSTISYAQTAQVITLSTDKAMYSPGSEVKVDISVSGVSQTAELGYQIFHLEKLVKTGKTTAGADLTWVTPAQDFKGYLIRVFLKANSSVESAIAVDASSDWSKFPRYGFLSDFSVTDSSKQQAVIDRLKRFHINGIQFYDWQDSHTNPLQFVDGVPITSWQDINHRTTYLQSVKNYIQLAHEQNMKAMNYNLAYGAYQSDASQMPMSALYTDAQAKNPAIFPLPGWESDLYLQDPGNNDWQEYIFAKEQKVQSVLEFDGWHVDQLGQANYYNASGSRVGLAEGFRQFLANAKIRLGNELVMNAVDGFGQREIMRSNATTFNYTEVWNNSRQYSDLAILVDQNWKNSKLETGKNLPSVLAAYMNYNKASNSGYFNEAGVLLTEASIFAAGGSHLELGEHLLGKEYFPNNNLKMSASLESKLQKYYDFSVAYQNLLRDQYTPVTLTAEIANIEVSLDTLSMPNTIWMFARNKTNNKVIHLVNLIGVSDSLWRDSDGKRKTPKLQKNLKISLYSGKKVKSVYLASPDGQLTAQSLQFKQVAGKVTFTIPSLQYWDMVVLNY